jgi:hypothetical protein
VQPGFTFLTELDRHLWVILSDPAQDDQNVVIVSITTLEPHKDQACLIPRGSHPWVTHDSCVAYDFARTVKQADLFALKDSGKIHLQEPLSEAILKKIQQAAADSTRCPMRCADILIDQGLLNC